MRDVGAGRQRHGHSYFGTSCWFVFSCFAMDVSALDWRTLAELGYCIARCFTRVHFYSWSESCLWPGELPFGAQFRQDLAGLGIADEVADHCSGFYRPAVAHCVYYDVIYLGAMLVAGALVA